MQFSASRPVHPPHIMPGRQTFGAQLPSHHCQIGEFDRLVASYAGYRSLAGGVAVGEIGHHRFGETFLGVDRVVRDTQLVGNTAGVVDILPGAASALAPGRGAVIVQL
jgi:hypothetical protein